MEGLVIRPLSSGLVLCVGGPTAPVLDGQQRHAQQSWRREKTEKQPWPWQPLLFQENCFTGFSESRCWLASLGNCSQGWGNLTSRPPSAPGPALGLSGIPSSAQSDAGAPDEWAEVQDLNDLGNVWLEEGWRGERQFMGREEGRIS